MYYFYFIVSPAFVKVTLSTLFIDWLFPSHFTATPNPLDPSQQQRYPQPLSALKNWLKFTWLSLRVP